MSNAVCTVCTARPIRPTGITSARLGAAAFTCVALGEVKRLRPVVIVFRKLRQIIPGSVTRRQRLNGRTKDTVSCGKRSQTCDGSALLSLHCSTTPPVGTFVIYINQR